MICPLVSTCSQAPSPGLRTRLSVGVLWVMPKELNGWRTVGCELGKAGGGGQYLEAVVNFPFLISEPQRQEAGLMAPLTNLTLCF